MSSDDAEPSKDGAQVPSTGATSSQPEASQRSGERQKYIEEAIWGVFEKAVPGIGAKRDELAAKAVKDPFRAVGIALLVGFAAGITAQFLPLRMFGRSLLQRILERTAGKR